MTEKRGGPAWASPNRRGSLRLLTDQFEPRAVCARGHLAIRASAADGDRRTAAHNCPVPFIKDHIGRAAAVVAIRAFRINALAPVQTDGIQRIGVETVIKRKSGNCVARPVEGLRLRAARTADPNPIDPFRTRRRCIPPDRALLGVGIAGRIGAFPHVVRGIAALACNRSDIQGHDMIGLWLLENDETWRAGRRHTLVTYGNMVVRNRRNRRHRGQTNGKSKSGLHLETPKNWLVVKNCAEKICARLTLT